MSNQPTSVSYNQPHDRLNVADKSPIAPLSRCPIVLLSIRDVSPAILPRYTMARRGGHSPADGVNAVCR